MSQATQIQTASPATTKYDHLARPDGMVHRSVFIDPQIFDEEMSKVFCGNWTFLLHESEIPNPNDFKSITVGRRPTIVSRSADGRITALLNRCAHRGSPVCIKTHGNARNFTCPYHGWNYSNTGDLISITFPAGYDSSFDKGAHHLGRFPHVQSYRGFVFGSLNPDVEPLEQWLKPAREVLDWAIDKDDIGENGVSVVRGPHYTLRANWKHQSDNNADGYHTAFLHASTNIMNRRRYGSGKWLSHVKDETKMVCQYLGNGHKLGDHRVEVHSSWQQARPVPGRETHGDAITEQIDADRLQRYLDLTGRAGINLVIYPNLFIRANGNFVVFEPLAVDRTNIRNYTTLLKDAPEELNTLRLRFDEDFANVGSRDDNDIIEQLQAGLNTIPEMEWLDFTRGMNRQTIDANGVVTSNKTDETAIRGSYEYWRELMNRDVRLTPV